MCKSGAALPIADDGCDEELKEGKEDHKIDKQQN